VRKVTLRSQFDPYFFSYYNKSIHRTAAHKLDDNGTDGTILYINIHKSGI